MPPHPTATATRAAIRLRHRRPGAAPNLREDDVSTAIGDALKPAFYQLELAQTTRLLPDAAAPVGLRYRSNNLIVILPVSSTKSPKQGGKAMPSTRTVSANGIEIFLREKGKGPLVLLCHGWPELSYSWRHQISAIAEAGFRVVAPDMRGFGRTSAPAEIGAYTIFHNVGDMVALVAALGEKQAIIVGHDWGAPVAWYAAMFRPDVFTKVAGLSVPPPSRGRGLPLETLRNNGITNFYWQYFQPPGVAEAEFERDVAATMRTVLAGRGFSDPTAHQYVQEGKGFLAGADPNRPLPNWLTEADIAYFADIYQKSGFRGGLNWYRNIDRNW